MYVDFLIIVGHGSRQFSLADRPVPGLWRSPRRGLVHFLSQSWPGICKIFHSQVRGNLAGKAREARISVVPSRAHCL
jgi:hypothetical protein